MGKAKIINCLSVGAENAVTGKQLAKMLNCHERDITMSINALRKNGVLICSNGSGFFLPKGDEDIKKLYSSNAKQNYRYGKSFKTCRGLFERVGAVMPRMRTIQEAAAELKKNDPNTAVTPYAIRQMVLNNAIPHIKAGKKRLINMDTLEKYLNFAN